MARRRWWGGLGGLKDTDVNEYDCNTEVYFVWIFRLFVQYEILVRSSSLGCNLLCSLSSTFQISDPKPIILTEIFLLSSPFPLDQWRIGNPQPEKIFSSHTHKKIMPYLFSHASLIIIPCRQQCQYEDGIISRHICVLKYWYWATSLLPVFKPIRTLATQRCSYANVKWNFSLYLLWKMCSIANNTTHFWLIFLYKCG